MAMMKTSEEIRRQNLLLAIARAGNAAKLAALAETAPAYLSQLKKQTPDSKTGTPKGMGDDIARRIEKALGEPVGWMDTPHDNAGARPARRAEDKLSQVTARHPDDGAQDGVVYVPESRIEFSGGHGRTAEFGIIEDQEPASYRSSWFQKYGINPDHVRRFRVSGRSMEPMLYARDTILVNTDETNIVDGRLYAIRYGDDLRVKFLSRRLDGTLILRSVNPDYKDEEVPAELANEHISVIGRVRDKSGTGGL